MAFPTAARQTMAGARIDLQPSVSSSLAACRSIASPTSISLRNASRAVAPLLARRPTSNRSHYSQRATQTLPTTSPLISSPARLASVAQQRSFTNGISRSLLAIREEAANRNPSNAAAQNAFYQTLLKANMPGIVVERHQSGHFASNDATLESYNRALQMMSGSTGAGNNIAPGAAGTQYLQTPSQLQAVGQAVAAHAQGASVSSAQTPNSGPIQVVVNESRGATFFRWTKFIVSMLAFGFVSLTMLTLAFDFLQSISKGVSQQNSKMLEVKAEKQKTRFSDVHGCDEAKEELQELVEFLKDPKKFTTLGGKLPKGILLVGPPGTGKTLLARAVAGEAGVPFHYMSGSEFDEVFVGVGARRVRDLFAAAKKHSPSIIFIDELDAVGGKRHARDANYVKQTLNQLLTEMDGFNQDTGVIVIAATNFPESLDKALTRPGRFDRHVTVDLPDVRGRIAILKHHASKIKAAPDVNLEAIASSTSGLSGAELESIVNQAAIHASRNKASIVSTKDFDWAKDKVIMGAEKKTMVVTPEEKLLTAYHEAGHALMIYYALKSHQRLYKVTILPRSSGSLGHTAWLPQMDKYSYTSKDYIMQIDTSLGGKIAEQLVYGNDMTTSGVSSDLQRATDVAYAMVARFGMSEKLGPMEYHRRFQELSSETKGLIEHEVRRLLEESQERGIQLLTAKRKELDRLAHALVMYETLDYEEVTKVIRGEDLPGRTKMPVDSILVLHSKAKDSETSQQPQPGPSAGEAPPPTPPPPPPPAPAL